MAKFDILPVHTDKYLADTTDLYAEHHGAYLMILMAMWRSEGRLPNDQQLLRRISRVYPQRWAKVWALIERFFVIDDEGYITQKRLHSVYMNVSYRVSIKRANGAKGGRPKSLKSQEAGKPNGSVSVNQNESESEANAVRLKLKLEEEERKKKKESEDDALRAFVDENGSHNPKASAPATARNGEPYAFEVGVIRLNAKNLAAWTEAFPNISLKGELMALAGWAAQQPNWFVAVSGALAKKQREALDRAVAAKAKAEAEAKSKPAEKPYSVII